MGRFGTVPAASLLRVPTGMMALKMVECPVFGVTVAACLVMDSVTASVLMSVN